MVFFKVCFACSVVLFLSGCAPRAHEIPNGPKPYQEGFYDGCSSGYVAAGNPYYQYKKDVVKSNSDQYYKEGWTDGFNTCKGKYDSIMR